MKRQTLIRCFQTLFVSAFQLFSNIRNLKLIYYFSIPIPKRKIEKIFTKTEIGHPNVAKILNPKQAKAWLACWQSMPDRKPSSFFPKFAFKMIKGRKIYSKILLRSQVTGIGQQEGQSNGLLPRLKTETTVPHKKLSGAREQQIQI